jgi:hypothetical protein
MKLLIMQPSPAFRHFLPLRYKYSTHHPSPPFMEPENSLPYLQVPATGPSSESEECSLHRDTLVPRDSF